MERDAVRVPDNPSDHTPWIVLMSDTLVGYYTDSMMAIEGWTLPAPADPWDTLPDALQAAWDAGEERDAEPGERHVYRRTNGNFGSTVTATPFRSTADFRFRPRPRPPWQDAEVVEASTAGIPKRRLFTRGHAGEEWWHQGDVWDASELIDPVPMTVQKKEER